MHTRTMRLKNAIHDVVRLPRSQRHLFTDIVVLAQYATTILCPLPWETRVSHWICQFYIVQVPATKLSI